MELEKVQDPQNPKTRTPQNQTRMFSNVEMEELAIKMYPKEDVSVTQQLKIMRRQEQLGPNISGWNRGLHSITTSIEHMKKYSVDNKTWKEDKTEF